MAKNYRASLRKSGASGKKKHRRVPHRRVLLPFVTTRVRRCQQVLSRAILLPSRHELSSPYMTYLLRISIPMAGVAQRFYAVSVISLRSQCRPRWVLPHVPSMLRPGESSPLQHAATRRHRTQTMQFCQIMGEFFRKVSYFAKETTNPVFMRVCGSYFVK